MTYILVEEREWHCNSWRDDVNDVCMYILIGLNWIWKALFFFKLRLRCSNAGSTHVGRHNSRIMTVSWVIAFFGAHNWAWLGVIVSSPSKQNKSHGLILIFLANMYSTVKPHLPLITNRVEFQLTSLPPPPTISLRQDFGRRVRSPIYRITPYVRSLSPKFNASMPNIMGRYGDSDSDISGTFSLPPDIKLRSTSSRGMKIPKPPGEAGRKNSGGFNLEQELGWTQAKYVELMVSSGFVWTT